MHYKFTEVKYLIVFKSIYSLYLLNVLNFHCFKTIFVFSKCQSSACKVIDSVCKCLENSSQLAQKTVHQLLKLIENLASHSISTAELKNIFLLMRNKDEPVSIFCVFQLSRIKEIINIFFSFHISLKFLGHCQKLPIVHMIIVAKCFLMFKKIKV